jgi:hypothetical protein
METLGERNWQSGSVPVELALQGYAALEDSTIVNLRTFATYSLVDTEHEGCKAGTGAMQAHATRTMSQQRTQVKVCAHPVPGTDGQRSFLGNCLNVFRIIEDALAATDASKVIGDNPPQMHYSVPCWYNSDGEALTTFSETWYTKNATPCV